MSVTALRQQSSWLAARVILPVAMALLSGLTGCGSGAPEITGEGPVWFDADNKDIEKPETTDPLLVWKAIDRTLFDQGEQLLDVERNFRIITGNRHQSRNINSFDEVPNSSWYTNRHHLFPMAEQELKRGRQITPGPDTTEGWLVFRPKVGGMTPGFWIEDSRGDQYILKFDPAENPEMATGAAAFGSRFFHAAGYHVPQETIVYWRPENVRIKEGVTYKGPGGVKLAFTRDVLDSILSRVPRDEDGRIRSLASLALPSVIGPFSYSGRRKDDPNDWCPHQDRRELRGLYVVASFVNHYDTKDLNTLTTFETENGNSFVKHYLIDFGSLLGSDGDNPKSLKKGYANVFDLKNVLFSMGTFGLNTWAWQYGGPPRYPSVGYFEADIFEPNKFDPIQPNAAFEEKTDRDCYWGAKIVMSFEEPDIRALVSTAQYSNPEAEEYIVQTLLKRREKIGKHWFAKVNPLDEFAFTYSANGITLDFTDLAIKYELESSAETSYRARVQLNGSVVVDNIELNDSKLVLSSSQMEKLKESYTQVSENVRGDDRLLRIELTTQRNNGKWSKPTLVWLAESDDGGAFTMVGIEHLD